MEEEAEESQNGRGKPPKNQMEIESGKKKKSEKMAMEPARVNKKISKGTKTKSKIDSGELKKFSEKVETESVRTLSENKFSHTKRKRLVRKTQKLKK